MNVVACFEQTCVIIYLYLFAYLIHCTPSNPVFFLSTGEGLIRILSMSLSASLATLALDDKEDAEMQQIFGNRIRNIEFIKKYYSCDHFHRIFTSRSVYLYLPDVKCMALSDNKFIIKDMPHISMLNKLLDQMISQNHILLFRGRTSYLWIMIHPSMML